MVQIGTIEYEAKVSNVAEAQSNAQDFADSHRDVGEAAEESSESVGLLAGTFGSAAVGANRTADEANQADTEFTLLRGTVGGVIKGFGRLFRMIAGGTALSTAAGAAKSLYGVLSGLTLSGVVGSITGALSTLAGYATAAWGTITGGASAAVGYVSQFTAWLAAGSSGALAFAGAVGAVVGVFGVWLLEISGVLGAIEGLGEMLRTDLPGWATDGITTIIGLFAGPLAVIGAFIVGFVRGGFDQAFAAANQVINTFFGAFSRTMGRIGSIVAGVGDGITNAFRNAFAFVRRSIGRVQDRMVSLRDRVVGVFEGVGDAITESVRTAFNSSIPATVEVPSVTIGGGEVLGNDVPEKTIGGGVINMPQLQTGGTVVGTGLAEVHEGEVVGQPGALLEAAGMSGGGGGGGGTTVEVNSINIDLSGDFDPSNVTRRELDSLADRLVDRIGDKTNRRSGVR